MIIVTSYQDPDLDGVGSMIGYAELLRAHGKDAVAALYGDPFVEARWVLEKFGIAKPKPTSDFNIAASDIVLVDTSGGDPIDPTIKPEQVVEVIDHRASKSIEKFVHAKKQVELIGAAATLVAERMQRAQHTPSRDAVITLLGGIVSNTLNFNSNNTSDRDHAMYEWLKPIANVPETFTADMFQAKTKLILDDLVGSILADGKNLVVGDTTIFVGQLELLDVPQVLKEHTGNLDHAMRTVLAEKRPTYALLALHDLQWKTTDIFVYDDASKTLMSKALDLNFQNNRAHLDHFLQRKQITPILKDAILQ